MAPLRLKASQGKPARCGCREGQAPQHGLLGLALAMGIAAAAERPARAQLSPNCLRDGKPLACAITPGAEVEPRPQPRPGQRPVPPPPTTLTVMYADHAAYRLIKEEAGCRHRGAVSACPATIVPRNGFGTPIPARYVGTAYEGGYRHEYRSRDVAITYFFVD